MFSRLITLGLPLAAGPVLATFALAEGAQSPGTVATLDLAARLYAQAIATDDALSAVTAFRLAQSVTLRTETDWTVTTSDATGDELTFQLPEAAVQDAGTPPPPDGTAVAAATDTTTPGFSAIALLTGQMEAITRDLAAGDEDLLALVDDAAAETARGRIGGANQEMALLAPGRKDVWEIPFSGMEQAEIGVFGDGTGGLGWIVADAGGVPVCIDQYSEDPLYCAFTPVENAWYTVTIISRSDVEGQYLLATN